MLCFFKDNNGRYIYRRALPSKDGVKKYNLVFKICYIDILMHTMVLFQLNRSQKNFGIVTRIRAHCKIILSCELTVQL